MTVLRRLGLRFRAAARGRISSITFFGWFVTAAAIVFGAAGSTLAGAAGTSCSSVGYTVAPLHGTRFYVDPSSSPVLDSGYTGVSITSSAAASNVWVKLSNFGGGALGLNANQPAALPLGNLTAGATTPAYFFLTATTVGDVAAAQTFDVGLYRGDPGRGGTLLCTFGDGYSAGLMATIKAAANKVQDVTGDGAAATVSTSSPVVGGTVTLSVEGTTGTLGSGPDGQPFVYETPDALGTWPAGAFRLVGTTLTLSPGASQTVYTNSLEIPRSTTAAQDYVVQYTFRITGTTASATAPYPIQEISSGTQVKHTDPSSLASTIPAIQPPTNTLTLTQSASAASLPSTGGNVTYTATLHSTSSASSSVDELVTTLPTNGAYVAGSAKLDGTTIADPTASGGTLVFPGPFSVSSAADRKLAFTVALPGTAGTYTDSTVGYVASTQIDTTTSTSDNAPASSSTTVAKAAQTITFPQPPDTRADQGPVAPGATASSGLSVSYASSTTGVCTVAGPAVTLVAAGTCTITASQPGDAQYAAAADVSRSFSVTAAPLGQTITFPQPADTAVDGGPVSLGATASSGLAVSYSSSTTGVCTVSGSSATLHATGTCTITASQAGNGTYTAAADVTKSFAVTRAAQSIAFPQPADTRVDQGPVALGATASSGLPVSYASSTAPVCTVSGSSVTLLAAGTCTVTASQAGNGGYAAAADVSRSFQVTTAPQTISFPQPADTRVDQGPVSLGATASSGLTVSYASSTLSVCTVSGGGVALLATGTCTITASQAGNAGYAAAADVTRSFAVTASPQTITFPQPAGTRVDQGPVGLGAIASSGLPVSYASSTASVCTVSGTSVTLLAPGTCTITASQAGNGVYAAAADVTRSFAVTLAAQSITFPQPADTRVDQGPVALGATASSGLAASYASSTTAVCTVSGSSVTLHSTGTCTITASQPGNATYAAAADVSRSFEVTTATQTIAFPGPADTAVDAGPVALAATASSGLPVSFTSNSVGVCAVSGSSVTLLATGTCSITASQAGDATYAAALPVTRTFQVAAAAPVTPLAQSITFPQPADTRVDQGPVSLAATASSGLPVSYASASSPVCTVSGASVTLVASGTCTITASQPGDGIYAAAADVSQSFAVTAAPQSIAFPQPADTRVDQGPVSPGATASSGLPVSYASSTASVCTVSGSSVTLLAPGTCSVTASQPGDDVYAAAADVTRSFAVTRAAQSITFPQPSDTGVDQGPVSLSATASSGLAVGYASSTSSACTVSGASVTLVAPGTCTITASQAGDGTYAAAADVARSFEVTTATQTIAFVGPSDTPLDGGPVALVATASSGLPVSFTGNGGGVCAVSGSSVTLLATGTCSITASQAGDSTYAAALPVTRTFDVTALAQSISFPQPADTQVDRGPVSLAAAASSGLPVSYASSTSSVCTVSGTSVTLLAPGTCTVTASQAGNGTYAAATDVGRSFQVTAVPSAPTPTAQSISFPQPADTPVDAGPVSLGATASSGLAVSYASSTPSVCTVSGASVTLASTGTCTITASQAGDSTYAAAADVTRSFHVTAAAPATPSAQSIAFPQPADTRVDQGPVLLGATASSGLAVSYASSTPSVCTVSGASVTLVAAGTCTITASQAGNGTYAAAADAARSFEVTTVPVATPTAQSIAFPQPADTRVDQGPVSLGATASSGLPVSYASTTTSVCTVSGSNVTLLATGTCSITASQAGDAAYAAATDVGRSFQVTAVPSASTPTSQSISFPLPADTRVDQGPVSLGATASSGLPVSYASSTASVCTVSGTSVTLLAPGTCTVTASQAGDATYSAAAPVTRSFEVTALPSSPSPTFQSITFPQPADAAVDGGPVSLGATASSGLAVSYASATPSVCTVSGASVTLVSAGTCTVTASQPGDPTTSAAADVTRSFEVTVVALPLPVPPAPTPPAPAPPAPAPAPEPQPQPQSIAFAPVPPVDGALETVTLPATATSGLPVSYDSATPAICSVSPSGVVTVLGPGVCTVSAHQPGNGGWLPAPDATLSFAVTPPPLPMPTTEAKTTVAGKTTRSLVAGIPAGASVALDGTPTLPGVASVRIVGSRVEVTPTATFSGVVDVPIVVTKDGRLVETTVSVLVRPKAPTHIAVTPLTRSRSQITWQPSASAVGYAVRVDGRVVCTTKETTCTLPALLSPSSNVVVTSLGHARTTSDVAHATYVPRRYVLIAIVHFPTASSTLGRSSKRILQSTEKKIAKGRFTHAMLTCHTDSAGTFAYNMALSSARCAAVARFIERRLGISHITYRQAAFAYLHPAAPNSTLAGMAKNRRVEVYVR